MNETFKKIKAAYCTTHNWYDPDYRIIITCFEKMEGLCKTLECFKKYLLNAYDILFIETELGIGHVTCINDEGIRVEYFIDSQGAEYYEDEWIDHDHMGNLDATKRKLVEQKNIYYKEDTNDNTKSI